MLLLCFLLQLMECCVNALVTSFKETILAECPGMIKRNETESEYATAAPSTGPALPSKPTCWKLFARRPNASTSPMTFPHLCS